MKKILSLTLALLVVVFLVPTRFSARAQESVLLSLSDAESARAGSVTVTLSLDKNPGLCALELQIQYDSRVLQLLEVKTQDLIGAALPRKNLSSPYPLTWIDFTSENDNTKTGILCFLTFRILENAPALGSTLVSVHPISAYNTNYEPVPVNSAEAQIVYVDQLRGDFNGDGTLSSDDARYLLYHVWGVGKEENLYQISQPADLNCDGSVSSDDALYLLYHTVFGQELYPL